MGKVDTDCIRTFCIIFSTFLSICICSKKKSHYKYSINPQEGRKGINVRENIGEKQSKQQDCRFTLSSTDNAIMLNINGSDMRI